MADPLPRPPRRAARAWPRRLLTLAALVTLLGVTALVPPDRAVAQAGKGGRVAAPELDGGTAWLGTDRPLRLRDLRGKIVILDFWTSC
jgi:hypothetical protein